jgi:hypothetical protein
MTMPERLARTGAARRSVKRKSIDPVQAADRAAIAEREPEPDDWVEADDDRERLEEGEMEMLLTGHAATHGIEGEDNWLLESEESKWGER